jgi:hypothetical protein
MMRLLSLLLLIAVSAALSSYTSDSGPELKEYTSQEASGASISKYKTKKAQGALLRNKSLRRVAVFKHRVLSHLSSSREYAHVTLVKPFTALFRIYTQHAKLLGLKLIFPQHYFW